MQLWSQMGLQRCGEDMPSCGSLSVNIIIVEGPACCYPTLPLSWRTYTPIATMKENPKQSKNNRRPERHIASTSRGSAAYPRKRAVTACQVCRARRTKCDQKKPSCSFCESIGAECTSDPAILSTFDPASLAIIQQLETIECKIDTLSRAPHQIETPIHCGSPHTTVVKHQLQILPESLERVLEWPVFQRTRPSLVTSPQFASESSRQTHDQVSVNADELDLALCNHLLDNFFAHVHIKNPVLNERQTRRSIRNVCLNGIGWEAKSCLTLLICANGALAHPFSSPSIVPYEADMSRAAGLYVAGQKRLGFVLGSAGIIQAQCLFFAGVYLMSVMRPFDAWRMFLQALAVCQSFHFIQNPDSAPDHRSSDDATSEESIYWSAWKSEREVRWELGLPDCSNPLSAPPQLFPSLSQDCETDNLRAWYFYLSEISLWRLETGAKNEMMKVANTSLDRTLDALIEISDSRMQQVLAWQNSLAPTVSLTQLDPGEEDHDMLRFVLRGRMTYMHELISWPFIDAVINRGDDSPRVREWAAMGLSFHLERLSINRSGFYHRHHGTWLMARSSARSACVLLAAALLPSERICLPDGWRLAVEATIEMLHFWRGDMCELTNLATSMKSILLTL